ncbi:hypothetical protein HanRHA438_Chr17g0831951 [Helianthus annuus]|nr:hypothetical protein HanRHA438_Chr17g0831951 [Helianthus annuus]
MFITFFSIYFKYMDLFDLFLWNRILCHQNNFSFCLVLVLINESDLGQNDTLSAG